MGHRPLVQERYDYQLPSVVLEDMFRKGFTEQDMFLGASTLLRISKNDEPNYEGGPDGEFDLRSRH